MYRPDYIQYMRLMDMLIIHGCPANYNRFRAGFIFSFHIKLYEHFPAKIKEDTYDIGSCFVK